MGPRRRTVGWLRGGSAPAGVDRRAREPDIVTDGGPLASRKIEKRRKVPTDSAANLTPDDAKAGVMIGGASRPARARRPKMLRGRACGEIRCTLRLTEPRARRSRESPSANRGNFARSPVFAARGAAVMPGIVKDPVVGRADLPFVALEQLHEIALVVEEEPGDASLSIPSRALGQQRHQIGRRKGDGGGTCINDLKESWRKAPRSRWEMLGIGHRLSLWISVDRQIELLRNSVATRISTAWKSAATPAAVCRLRARDRLRGRLGAGRGDEFLQRPRSRDCTGSST
jgi:hypothetical protein